MNLILEKPVLGLDEEFPDILWILYHQPSDRYGCYCHKGIHGLVCFSTKELATGFIPQLCLYGMETIECTFEEAREKAKTRPAPVIALMLLDDIVDPKIHYVK